MNSDKVHQIALTLVPKVGLITARKLIANCGSAEAVFQESRKGLLSIPGIGRTMTDSILAERDKCSMDRILIKSRCKPSLVMEILLSLELKGLVKALAGNQYAKS